MCNLDSLVRSDDYNYTRVGKDDGGDYDSTGGILRFLIVVPTYTFFFLQKI